MIRRPPRSTQSRSSAASDVYKRQAELCGATDVEVETLGRYSRYSVADPQLCLPDLTHHVITFAQGRGWPATPRPRPVIAGGAVALQGDSPQAVRRSGLLFVVRCSP